MSDDDAPPTPPRPAPDVPAAPPPAPDLSADSPFPRPAMDKLPLSERPFQTRRLTRDE